MIQSITYHCYHHDYYQYYITKNYTINTNILSLPIVIDTIPIVIVIIIIIIITTVLSSFLISLFLFSLFIEFFLLIYAFSIFRL